MAIQDTDLLIAYRPADQAHYKLSLSDLPSGDVIVSDTAPDPTGYSEGQLWWNSDSENGSLYVLYDDPAGGDGGDTGGLKWVQATPTGVTNENGEAGEYLKTDAAAGDQTVASTGTTTFDGLVEAGEGVKVTGKASSSDPGVFRDNNQGAIQLRANTEFSFSINDVGQAGINEVNSVSAFNIKDTFSKDTGFVGVRYIAENIAVDKSNQYGFLLNVPLVDAANTVDSVYGYFAGLADTSKSGDKTYGFYGRIGNTSVPGQQNYNFFAELSAPNFFAGDTYIGGNTTRNTRELWESLLTEEQKEQLAAGTLVVPANVATPGDGEFARQWWYDQQSAEDQALIDSGELDYPEHFAAATFTDTFDLGDNTNINLLSSGLGEFSGGVKVTGGSLATVPDGIYKDSGIITISNNGVPAIYLNDVSNNCSFYDSSVSSGVKVQIVNRDKPRTLLNIISNEEVTDANNTIARALKGIQVASRFEPGQATNNVIGFFFNSNDNVESADVTNQYGFYVSDTAKTAVNNYGFFSFLGATNNLGGNNYNFYASSEAPNYFRGEVRGGGTNGENNNWVIRPDGSTSPFNIQLQMQSDEPTAFQTTYSTDEEGNQVENTSYIGESESLLAIIKDLRARVEALEAAATS